MKVIKSIYNFIVGDMIILVGVLLAIVILTLIHSIDALAPLRVAEGPILIIAILAVLVGTLSREAFAKR